MLKEPFCFPKTLLDSLKEESLKSLVNAHNKGNEHAK